MLEQLSLLRNNTSLALFHTNEVINVAGSWLLNNAVNKRWLWQAWVSLNDGESYVRASAAKTLIVAAQMKDQALWQQLVTDKSVVSMYKLAERYT